MLGLLISREFFVPELQERTSGLTGKVRQESYYGVWFKNKRIGYVAEELLPEGETSFILRQRAYLRLNVLNTDQPVKMQLKAQLDNNLILQNFHLDFHSPFYSMKADGTVHGSIIDFSLDTGQAVVKDSVTLDRPPLIEMNDRGYLLNQLQKIGERARLSSFDPVSLTGKNSTVEYRGQEKVLIHGRIHKLHKFIKTFSGVRISFWINDKGKVIKEQSAAGFVFLAEPKFKAMDIESGIDELLGAVSVPFKGNPPGPDTVIINYHLDFPQEIDLDLEGGRQHLNGPALTITKETVPVSTPGQLSVPCNQPGYLTASRYIQSDNNEIKKLARDIVQDEKDRLKQARLIADWVFTNLEKRPVIGLPDALTTLRSRRGDCNEHAVLFCALARSISIPTAIATGVTLFRGTFYYHAWNEVCLGNRWFSLDTTNNQFPADLTHIRLARGGMDQQIKIGGLLGKLKIEILDKQTASEKN